jgi:hypothetical protein
MNLDGCADNAGNDEPERIRAGSAVLRGLRGSALKIFSSARHDGLE